MTKFRTDAPNSAIDWPLLLNVVARAPSFSVMRDPIYASGSLRTGYLERVEDDVEIRESVDGSDVNRLRDLLTWIVRGDRFRAGVGDEAYWCGHLDAIFAEIGKRVGTPYPFPPAGSVLPRRIPRCPTCSDTHQVQYIVYGMPPASPAGFDRSRVRFGQAVASGTAPSWHCPSCELSYDYPGLRIADPSVSLAQP